MPTLYRVENKASVFGGYPHQRSGVGSIGDPHWEAIPFAHGRRNLGASTSTIFRTGPAGSPLRGLEEQLRALDGTLVVESEAGEVTRLVARIPLHEDEATEGSEPANEE